jgi:hypothetical protein
VVVFDDESAAERPDGPSRKRDVRSIAHLKMLQSLAGKLNRLNDVALIGEAIVDELRTLIDYHACRVYVDDGALLVPVALRGEHEVYEDESVESLIVEFGEGESIWRDTLEPVHDLILEAILDKIEAAVA